MQSLNVNVKLLPIKAHFFFCQAGSAPLTPFLVTIAKDRGYSILLVGIIFSVLSVITVLSRPLFGAITDHFRCQRKTFIWSIIVCLLSTVLYSFLPDSPSNVDNSDNVSVLATCEFWLFFIFLMSRGIAQNITISLTKTICLQLLGKNTHRFGMQKIWGSISYGGISLLTGWLIDWYSEGKPTKDYTPGVIIAIIFTLADLLTAMNFDDCQDEETSTNIFKDLKKVLNDMKVISFLIWTTIFGIFYGSINLYLIWHMEELVRKYHPEQYSSLKTLQGGLLAVKCFIGDAPFYFVIGKIIKKVGHINSMLIGFFMLSVRFFLYFIFENPVWMLPVELLSGPSIALPYTSLTAYGAIIAPKGLIGTIQGIIDISLNGIGVTFGSYMTSYLFNKIGSSNTYLVMSLFALVVCFLQSISIIIMARKSKPKKKKEIIQISTIA